MQRRRRCAHGIFPRTAADKSQARKNILVDTPGGVRCQRISISIDGSQKVRFTLRRQRAAGPERRMERGSETGGD